MENIPVLPPSASLPGRPDAAAVPSMPTKDPDREAVRRAAEDFESVFVTQMLAPMFASLRSDGLFGGGPSEEVYRSMLIDEYGKAIARAGGFGIADAVEREILQLQEVAS